VFWDITSYLQGKHLIRVHDRRELVKRFAKWLPPDTHKTFDTMAGIDAFDVQMPQLLRQIAGQTTGVRAVQIEQAHGVPELFVMDQALVGKKETVPSPISQTPESSLPTNIHTHVNWTQSGHLQLNPHQPSAPSIHVGASTGVRVTEERLITSLPYQTETPPWLTHIQHECLQCLRAYSHNRTTDTRALRDWCQQYPSQKIRHVLNTWMPAHMRQRVTVATGSSGSVEHTNLQYVDVCCTPFGIAAIMGCPLTVLRVLIQYGAKVHTPCPPVLHGRLLRFLRHKNSNTNNRSKLTVSTYLQAIMNDVNTMTPYRKQVLQQLLRA
jgi:hypothetical protein